MKRTKKLKKPYEHAGGGCMLVGNHRYPCDDEYVHRKSGKRIIFATTMATHFAMPITATLKELKAIKGAKMVRSLPSLKD